MALYPHAKKRLIPAGSNDPSIIVVGAILHVDAGNAPSLYDYFAHRSGGIESHFHIPKEGATEQYRDTAYEADANYKANSFTGQDGKRYGFVSIETQGYGAGEWNAHQLDEIKRLLTWLSKKHGFPLRVAPGPFSPGVGYHTLFGAPSLWTPVAKSCPGPDRIRQFNDVLVPWMKGGDPKTQTSERTEPMPEMKDLKAELVPAVVEALMKRVLVKKDELTVADALRQAAKADDVLRALATLPDRIADAIPPTNSLTRDQIKAAAETALRSVLGSLDNDLKETP